MISELMSTKTEDTASALDTVKWLLVVGLVAGGIYANAMYSAEPLWLRGIIGVGLALFTLLIAYSTRTGKAVWDLAREARMELRKVVWPTTTEWGYTTVQVVIVVLIVAFLLWLIDLLLGWLVQGVIG